MKTERSTTETLLYGLPKGETERYMEQLLATNRTPAQFEIIKRIASVICAALWAWAIFGD